MLCSVYLWLFTRQHIDKKQDSIFYSFMAHNKLVALSCAIGTRLAMNKSKGTKPIPSEKKGEEINKITYRERTKEREKETGFFCPLPESIRLNTYKILGTDQSIISHFLGSFR